MRFNDTLYVLFLSCLTTFQLISLCRGSIKLARLIKICLAETYSRVRVCKNLSDMFSIRNGLEQGDVAPLLFNFSLDYPIRRVQVNQGGLKLNGTYQLLVYADYINILGGSVHTRKENAEALVAASKEIGLEINADKSKYMVMSRDQNAGRSHNTNSFEGVDDFKYLETILQNQNSM